MMGRKKKFSESVRNSNCTKEKYLANLHLSPQPIVCLTKLNIPEFSKRGKANNFTINVNSNNFKKLLINSNTQPNRFTKRTSKSVKPTRKVQKNYTNSSSVECNSNSIISNKTKQKIFTKRTSKSVKPTRKVQENGTNSSSVECKSNSITSNKTKQEIFTKRTSKYVKPTRKVRKNGTNSSSVECNSNSIISNKTKQEISGPISENVSELSMNVDPIEPCVSSNQSGSTNQLGDKENQNSRNLDTQEHMQESKNEATHVEDDTVDCITRTDKIIDTFLNVLRKTTDDNSILSALQRDYICGRCEQGFLKKGSLRKHMLLCGSRNNKKTCKRKKKDGNYSCPMCGITYLNKYSLDKHNANIHNLKKMYKCLVCSQHFYNEEALTLHCRSRHGLGGSDIYKCPYCDATFNLRGDLNYHCRKAHNTTQYYVCSKCLECFKNEDTCKLHEQSHGYCCDICMYKTKSESEMIAHRSTHLYMVVHKCDKCSRTFKAKRYFTKHIKVHEKERKL